MKIDRLQIKLIIGLIFVIIMSILIFFLEPKDEKVNNVVQDKVYVNTNNTNNIN